MGVPVQSYAARSSCAEGAAREGVLYLAKCVVASRVASDAHRRRLLSYDLIRIAVSDAANN